MSVQTSPPPMQPDKAGLAAGMTCSACSKPVETEYYQAADKVICANCRAGIETELTGGSASGRFWKALVLGGLAAMLGSLVYFAILKLTGYEIGIVAIVVGLMVGWAVRKGSRARGGWVYQTMAVVLTYFSIVTTYVPFIIQGMKEGAEQAEQPVASQSNEQQPAAGGKTEAASQAESGQDISVLGFIIGGILILLLACAAPWLAGFQNFVGWIIIGIGLHQAWRLNKKLDIEISGPYAVGAAPGATS